MVPPCHCHARVPHTPGQYVWPVMLPCHCSRAVLGCRGRQETTFPAVFTIVGHISHIYTPITTQSIIEACIVLTVVCACSIGFGAWEMGTNSNNTVCTVSGDDVHLTIHNSWHGKIKEGQPANLPLTSTRCLNFRKLVSTPVKK